ncbi:MAG: hypothetical protein BLITH_0608 [Brockia lithotrophica]|uniref:Uncharacterized protein n=1 Tax=Brockia lithotrophica TaxID=933949 RepID=A0A2T5G8E4_9BACL|nr:MAG: hypothetical protein BLITH_0608 [Brockia lithotrophica]
MSRPPTPGKLVVRLRWLLVLGIRFDVSPLTRPEKPQSENSQKNGVPRSL